MPLSAFCLRLAGVALVVLLVDGTPAPASHTAYDPPFDFPVVMEDAAAGVPAETHFTRGCFNYVYGMLQPSEKQTLDARAAELPEKMMTTCKQADKKGCQRFIEELQEVLATKEKVGTVGHPLFQKRRDELKAQAVSKARQGIAAKTAAVAASVPAKPAATQKKLHWHHHAAASVAFVQTDIQKKHMRSLGQWCKRIYTVATAAALSPIKK